MSFLRLSLLGRCAGDRGARARTLCELLFLLCTVAISAESVAAGARSGSNRLEEKALSVESELDLFPPCVHSLSSQQWYLCLRGSNSGTGGFLWARHTLILSRKSVRLQTAPDPPPPQVPALA